MIGSKTNKPTVLPSAVTSTVIWILISSFFSAGCLLLSLLCQLNRHGTAVILFIAIPLSALGYYKLNGSSWSIKGFRWHRFRRPFPLLYLICASASVIGGIIHPPTNHDTLCYRIPRLLHWLSQGQWHWIGGADTRMDFSGVGFETMTLPIFWTFQTLRFAFLINAISYLLLPSLIFLVFHALGVKRSVAALWMWILPCASCFVMEAGSIGSDLPACIYTLAALLFGLRAMKMGKWTDIVLAVLSSALMTGMKASNLPLLLPITLCLLRAFWEYPKLIYPVVITSCFATLISFLPIAIANTKYTGDWAGDKNSLLKIHDPVVGIAGNALIIGTSGLVPAVFPQADKVNSWFNNQASEHSLKWIKNGFADFRMTHPQMASEESSGLGLGVFSALALGLVGAWKHIRLKRLVGLGGVIFIGFWVALLFYMIKLGNCGAPRLIAPYYVGLVGLPLLLIQSGSVFTRRWWRWISLVLLLPILPALAMNPARPLLPMKEILGCLKEQGINSPILTRMEVVYDVYANRSDAHRAVRDLLPTNASSIGFAGTSGESQYSFWLPMGSRHVTDYTPRPDGELPDVSDFDAIVASTWGTNDRFGITPKQLAEKLGWTIVGTTQVRALASSEATEWSVLVPKNPRPAHDSGF